jgi:hypothetical protein
MTVRAICVKLAKEDTERLREVLPEYNGNLSAAMRDALRALHQSQRRRAQRQRKAEQERTHDRGQRNAA